MPKEIKINKDGTIGSIKNLITKGKTSKNNRPLTGGEFGIGNTEETNRKGVSVILKGGLTSERLDTLSKILKTEKPVKQKSEYPIYVPSELAKQTRRGRSQSELIHEIISYPPGTSPSIAKLLSLGKPETRHSEMQQPLFIDFKDLIKAPKNESKERLVSTVSQRTKLSNQQGLKLDLGNIQTQRGFVKQGITSIVKQGQIQMPKQFITTRQGQYTLPVFKQGQVPTFVQTTQGIQLQTGGTPPPPPTNPPPPQQQFFKLPPPEYPFSLGGFFGSGGRGGANSRKQYELTYESSDINVKYLEGYTPFLKSSSNPNILKANQAIDRKAIRDYNRSQRSISFSSMLEGFSIGGKKGSDIFSFVTPKKVSKRKKR